MYHWVSSDSLKLEGAYSQACDERHIRIVDNTFIGVAEEIPDKEETDFLLTQLLDPELCHSGSVLV